MNWMTISLLRIQNKGLCLGAACSTQNVFLRKSPPNINVIINRPDEKGIGLKRHSKQGVKLLLLHGFNIFSFYINSPRIHRIKPLQKLDQCGFAAAGSSDNSQYLTLLQMKRNMFQRIAIGRLCIGKTYIIKYHAFFYRRFYRCSCRPFLRQIHHLSNTVCRSCGLGKHDKHFVH